VLPPAVHGAVS